MCWCSANGELAKIINTDYKEFIEGKFKTEAAVKKARQRALQAQCHVA